MFFGVLFQAVNRSSLVLQRALINVIVNGVLTIIFIWLFGAWGAAVGTVTAIILFVYPYCIWHARRELKVRTADLFSMRGLGQVFVCAALAAVPVIIILRSMGELSAVWSLCLSAIVYGLGYILVGQISGFVKLSNIMAVLQQIKRT